MPSERPSILQPEASGKRLGQFNFMRPIINEGIFSWLHSATGDVGVIISPGLGHDDRQVYRSMYHLANLSAQAGYPTLRLQYRGTGNSGSIDTLTLEGMRRDLSETVRWFRETAQLRAIVVCGFRIGALLAALEASSDNMIDALILLDPITSGRQHVRQLRAMMSLHGQSSPSANQCHLETFDFRLDEEFLERLSRIEISDARIVTKQALILSPSMQAGHRRLDAQLRSSGCASHCVEFEHFDSMMRLYDRSDIPHADFDRIMAWLRSAFMPVKRRQLTALSDECTMVGDVWLETLTRLGLDGQLVGIHCYPRKSNGPTDKAILLTSAGTEPSYGAGRLNVLLARRLAGAGIATLRFDFAGLGDSEALPGNARSWTYSTSRSDDFRAAIRWLRSKGYTRFGIVGHCSGAYHAFQYALEGERIDHLYLVNMLVFSWAGEGSVEFATAAHSRGWLYYRRKIFDRRSWRRMMAKGRCLQQLFSIGSEISTRMPSLIRTLRRGARASPLTHAYPHTLIERLTRRGTRIAFLVGERDESASELELYYGSGGKEAARHDGVVVSSIPNADHSLTTSKARSAVVDEIVRLAVATRSAPDAWTPKRAERGSRGARQRSSFLRLSSARR